MKKKLLSLLLVLAFALPASAGDTQQPPDCPPDLSCSQSISLATTPTATSEPDRGASYLAWLLWWLLTRRP